MSPDPARLRRSITEFNFKPLFVEELGWDDVRTAPLTVQAGDQPFMLTALAQKRGLLLLLCPAIPPYAVRRMIDKEVTKVHREHVIVFAAPDRSAQVWLWVRREPGKPAASRERHYRRSESGERVAQTLAQMSFDLDEEGDLTLFDSTSRVKAAFDVDRVTKKFYERFKKEHESFLKFIHGIPDDGFHRWYASVMLNRLMFIYFVQRKGFMAGDLNYLGTRLTEAEKAGRNYYRDFLRVLFFQGFAVREQQRSAEINQRLGSVPYLNGGLFAMHTVEEAYGDSIEIENGAFARLFDFFDDYNWHLDERPLRDDKEINPDVLGYIFEKYINQKQMGAYYTKEDITDYICKNVIIPYLLDAVRREQPAAFDASADLDVMLAQLRSAGKLENLDAEAQGRRGTQRENEGGFGASADFDAEAQGRRGAQREIEGRFAASEDFDAETQGRRGAQREDSSSANLRASASLRQTSSNSTVWRLLAEDPDRYIYPAMQHGVREPLPDEIAAGIDDVGQRTLWNRSAPPEYALPTEIWREVVARRQRYAEVRGKLAGGAVTASDDLITLNLNIRQFARDVIETCEDPSLLRAFWQALLAIAVLDPTGGSGAFLFAALTILEDLYDACLDRMEWFVDERPADGRLSDFRTTLGEVARHLNRRYFILKSIIVNNLYAVDIMEEAVEICKLRLFLKLVAQVERAERIEPLPDIDFNIRAGNTLVGFVSREDVRAALELEQTGTGAAQGKLIFGEEQSALERIEEKAKEIDRAFAAFRALQTQIDAPADAVGEAKAGLKAKLRTLEDELNRLLARVYGVKVEQEAEYRRWLASHKPFHWFVEFYGVLQKGGFDAIVGNPPYVEYREIKSKYTIKGYQTESCGNLYAFTIERNIGMLMKNGRLGMIIPVASVCTDRYTPLQDLLTGRGSTSISSYNDRPGKLFDGLEHIRLSIILFESTLPGKQALSTTKYNRWLTVERPVIFELLEYLVPNSFRSSGSIPKLRNRIESSILGKLTRYKKTVEMHIQPRGRFPIYYTRKLSSFVQILDSVPRMLDGRGKKREPSELKEMPFGRPEERDVLLAALNSSLFYWYLTVYSDCRNLNKRDVYAFPIDVVLMPQPLRSLLAQKARNLMSDLQEKSKMMEMRYSGLGTLTIQCFYPKLSKGLIDDIDLSLGQFYGFTDEELDYIINYDIKYRLGADDGDGEEE